MGARDTVTCWRSEEHWRVKHAQFCQFQTRTPDPIVSDVVMPGMNSIDLGIAVRRDFSSCKVLLFSGQAATAGRLEEASHRFELLATVHPVEFLETVAQLIG